MEDPLICNQIADRLLRDKGHYAQAINYSTIVKREEEAKIIARTRAHSVHDG